MHYLRACIIYRRPLLIFRVLGRPGALSRRESGWPASALEPRAMMRARRRRSVGVAACREAIGSASSDPGAARSSALAPEKYRP